MSVGAGVSFEGSFEGESTSKHIPMVDGFNSFLAVFQKLSIVSAIWVFPQGCSQYGSLFPSERDKSMRKGAQNREHKCFVI